MGMEEVTVTALAEVMSNRNVRVLDVRNPDEFRSWQVCAFLDKQGYQVVNVIGGTGAWRMNGLPLTQGMGA